MFTFFSQKPCKIVDIVMPEDLKFDIDPALQKELEQQFNDLEVVSERIKKLRKSLPGFADVLDVYKDLWKIIIVPLKYTIPKSFLTILTTIFTCIIGLLMIFVGMPLVSGFMRLPWKETLFLVIPLVALGFINSIKVKLGVTL